MNGNLIWLINFLINFWQWQTRTQIIYQSVHYFNITVMFWRQMKNASSTLTRSSYIMTVESVESMSNCLVSCQVIYLKYCGEKWHKTNPIRLASFINNHLKRSDLLIFLLLNWHWQHCRVFPQKREEEENIFFTLQNCNLFCLPRLPV